MTFFQCAARMIPLAVLLCVSCSSALFAADESSIRAKLREKLNGCVNEQVCCFPCGSDRETALPFVRAIRIFHSRLKMVFRSVKKLHPLWLPTYATVTRRSTTP